MVLPSTFTITRTGAVRFQFVANTATAPCFTQLAKQLNLLHDSGDRPAFLTLGGHPGHRGEMSPTWRSFDAGSRVLSTTQA